MEFDSLQSATFGLAKCSTTAFANDLIYQSEQRGCVGMPAERRRNEGCWTFGRCGVKEIRFVIDAVTAWVSAGFFRKCYTCEILSTETICAMAPQRNFNGKTSLGSKYGYISATGRLCRKVAAPLSDGACRAAAPAGRARRFGNPRAGTQGGLSAQLFRISPTGLRKRSPTSKPDGDWCAGHRPVRTLPRSSGAGRAGEPRPVVITRFKRVEDVKACQILFVCDSETKRLPAVLAKLAAGAF